MLLEYQSYKVFRKKIIAFTHTPLLLELSRSLWAVDSERSNYLCYTKKFFFQPCIMTSCSGSNIIWDCSSECWFSALLAVFQHWLHNIILEWSLASYSISMGLTVHITKINIIMVPPMVPLNWLVWLHEQHLKWALWNTQWVLVIIFPLRYVLTSYKLMWIRFAPSVCQTWPDMS